LRGFPDIPLYLIVTKGKEPKMSWIRDIGKGFEEAIRQAGPLVLPDIIVGEDFEKGDLQFNNRIDLEHAYNTRKIEILDLMFEEQYMHEWYVAIKEAIDCAYEAYKLCL
jgi:hypothetical protein